MAFKQRSSGPFKMMGSSPAKQETDPKKISFKQRSLDFWNQPAENRVSSEEPKKKSKPKGNFNKTGSKGSTTPGYSSTKAAKTTTPKKGINLVKRTTDLMHKNEMKIGELKKSSAQDVKNVKGKTVKISKKDVLKQMKTAGTKLPYSSVKNALKTSIKAAGKVAKFIPGVAGLVLSATKTATADQPTKGKGKTEYTGGKIDFTKKK